MSNSSLVDYTLLSPNCNSPRNSTIKKITIHHMAGNLSVERCGNVFAPSSRQASSNYGIGSDGRVGLYVEEKNRAWTSSSPSNDHQAVTIEVADDVIGGNWHSSDLAIAKLIDLCVDICKRNGIAQLNYTGDSIGNLTRHNMFTNTTCPGAYLQSKFPYIAEEVNKRLNSTEEFSEEELKMLEQINARLTNIENRLSALENGKSVATATQKYHVTANGVNVRISPNLFAKVNKVYYPNTQFEILEDNGTWIRCSDGWIKKAFVTKL